MVQTKSSGDTLRATMLKKHGSEDALSEYYKKIGAKGGRAKVPKGFALNPELASKAGSISKRGKKISQ